MVKLVTYTDDRMTISAMKLRDSAYKYGVDEVRIYTPADLPDYFRDKMGHVLQHEKGAGFYCWKPWVVADAITHMEGHDILIWSDAGTEIIENVYQLIHAMDNDNLFFDNGFKHIEWCKMDLIKRMFPEYGNTQHPGGPVITERVQSATQLQASQFLVRATVRMKRFMSEWLNISLENGMIDNEPSIFENVNTFAEHRWDQSILCCLQIMYGFRLHWFPTTTAHHIRDAHPDDHYPAIFNHHRKRNNEY